jgi:general secretion pathway protein F/type IV pilus assembly protein PilC
MPSYQYVALDSRGKKKKGFVESESQAKAMAQLSATGLTPLSISPVRDKGQSLTQRFSLAQYLPAPKVNISESFYYLGMLLQSGTPLSQSLDLLGRMSTGKSAKVWMDIRDSVESGQPFSQSMLRYNKIFPAVYAGMVKVAESVGRLGPVLEQIARYEENRAEVSGKLLNAMIYPAVICVVGFGAVYFLLSQVLPKITKIFTNMQRELPWNTKVLLGMGQFFSSLGLFGLLIPVVLVLIAIAVYRRSPVVRERVDKFLWRWPLNQRHLLARFSGLLGFQLEAGIPLVQALDASAGAIESHFFRKIILDARAEVATGQPLDRVLAKQNIFPDLYIMTLATGQKAGQLGEFLLRLGRILEREVDNSTKRLVALAEPLLILVVGIAIAFIVLAIMGPIFSLSTLVR